MASESKEAIINAAEDLNDINVAVRQDMADLFVTEGMRPKIVKGSGGGESK